MPGSYTNAHAAAGVWSIVTIVPSGYREFCYKVDGRFAVSKKHPTNIDGSCNWRTVYGPPAGPGRTGASKPVQHWFVEFAVNIADSMQRITPIRLQYDASEDFDREEEGVPLLRGSRRSSQRMSGSYYDDVEGANTRRVPGATRRKQTASWLDRPLRVAIISVAMYASVTVVYVVWKYLLTVS